MSLTGLQRGINVQVRNRAIEKNDRPLRVAVVDDEPLIRELLYESVHEMGHEIACFADARQALECMQFRSFDVIFTDVRMPHITGIEFYERMRTADAGQTTRVVFMTGDALCPEIQALLARTGCLYLGKPFRQAQLRALLGEVAEDCRMIGKNSKKEGAELPVHRAA